MLRYDTIGDLWISNKNIDDTDMPTSNLEEDFEVCGCLECDAAITDEKGSNWSNFPIYFTRKYLV
jgi:hypothetical protein